MYHFRRNPGGILGRNMMKKRELSILKGIGIFFVVYGHALFSFAYPLIQAANVTVFFLVAGWSYDFKKYSGNVSGLIGARLHKFMIPYIMYMMGYLVLHNVFYRWGMYLGQDTLYTDLSTYINVFAGYFQLGFDSLCGPTWFMAPYLISTALWGNLIYVINRKYKGECKDLWRTVLFFAVIFGILGVLIIQKGIMTGYRWEIALLMLPVMAFGKLVSINWDRIHRYFHPLCAFVAWGGGNAVE